MIWAFIPLPLQRYVAKSVLICGILLAAVSLRACDVHNQRRIGFKEHAAKVETATNDAVSKAGSAARKSANGSSGVLNPYYAD